MPCMNSLLIRGGMLVGLLLEHPARVIIAETIMNNSPDLFMLFFLDN